MRIDTMDDWLKISRKLSAYGYMLWQMQHDIDAPEGFICGFMVCNDARPRIELVTKDAAVRDAMLRYKP